MEKNWRTCSVKLDGSLYSALLSECKRLNISPNKYIHTLVFNSLEHYLDNTKIAKGQGIPQFGINEINYNKDTNLFIWNLRTDAGNITLANDLHFDYLINLDISIKSAIKQRNEFVHGKGDNVNVPKDILNYKVSD